MQDFHYFFFAYSFGESLLNKSRGKKEGAYYFILVFEQIGVNILHNECNLCLGKIVIKKSITVEISPLLLLT